MEQLTKMSKQQSETCFGAMSASVAVGPVEQCSPAADETAEYLRRKKY